MAGWGWKKGGAAEQQLPQPMPGVQITGQRAALHFFPLQVGPPTPYAVSRQHGLLGVLFFQFLMTIVRMCEYQFRNIPIAITMAVGVLVGCWAWKENMNITYICWWGVLCTAGCILGIIGVVLSFAIQISSIVVQCLIPFSCFCGMVLAWWLYEDYESEYQTTDMLSSWLRTFGLLKDNSTRGQMTAAYLKSGGGPQGAMAAAGVGAGAAGGYAKGFFGGGSPYGTGSGDLAQYKQQGSDQFAAGKAMAGGYLASGQQQARGFFAQGQQQAAGMQAQAAAMQAQGQEQARGWFNQGQQQFAGMQAQGQDQFAQGQQQAMGMREKMSGQFNSMRGQAAQQYGTMQGQAAGAAANANQQADGFGSWLSGLTGPPETSGTVGDIRSDPFLTR